MAKKSFIGITDEQKLAPENQIRDTRGSISKLADWLSIPANMTVALLMMGSLIIFYPGIGDYVLLTEGLMTLWGLSRKETAPLKMPIQSGALDPNEPHPATGLPTPGQGIFFIGNDIRNGKEIWLTNSDCRQHFLVLGTTGAGKPIAEDEEVLTPDGWRVAGDLVAGDMVTVPTGEAAPLSGVFRKGVQQLFRVALADGRSTEATTDHVWLARPVGGAVKVMDTAEIARRLAAGEEVELPMPRALPLPEAHLSPDMEAGAALRAMAGGSVAQRRALFNALSARSDARVAAGWKGMSQVDRLSRQDCSAYAAAARSLGGRAFEVSATDGLWSLVWGDVEGNGGPRWMTVTSVEATRQAKTLCLAVDHPDHLFVAGRGCVVTHNTETLLGFAANALSWGSGFLFCDGKGDVALFAKVYAMARRFGREDDLLVLNFMNGNEDVGVMGGRIRSNTMNPFATGSSDGLTQMVVSLMDDVGGDGAMWKGRATAMLTGVMRALCFLRESGIIDLNVEEIRDHMALRKIIELGDERKYPDLPQHIRKSILAYLQSLPGYAADKGEKQAQTTLDQHGYLEMQFTKILGSLADVYGHIFKTPYGEVDMHDVVLNRRILVIMLPALEKSGDEIANLGKIVVATLKGMMGGTLGSRLDGGWADVVENRPTNSPSPFICILDEVGYYTVEGMALMAAQARSLGFSMVYASQDIPAMKRLNEKEAASIVANTNTKIFMRTEEVKETGALAVETGDKAMRARNQGFERQVGQAGTYYTEGGSVGFEETNRISFTDLKAQGEGEMHILQKDKVVRARGFYANPEGSVETGRLGLRPNHFITVKRPSKEDIGIQIRGPELMSRMANPEFPAQLRAKAKELCDRIEAAAEEGDEVAMVARTFDRLIAAKRKPIEAACAAVADVMRALRGATNAFVEDVRQGSRQPSGFGPDLDIVTNDDGYGGIAGTGGYGGGGFEMPGGFDTPGGFDVPGGFDNYGGHPDDYAGGVPFSGATPPPHEPPRRAPFSTPRRPPRVDGAVPHGVGIDGGSILNMADNIGTNDAIMRSLASLDFDSDRTSSGQVESAIEEALGFGDGPEEEADRGRVMSTVEAFDRAASSVMATAPNRSARPSRAEEEDDGGETGGNDDQLVTAFLEQLMSDD